VALCVAWGVGYLVQSHLALDRAERFMPPVWVLPAALAVSALLVVVANR
jgi:hypothetical protein